MNNNFVLQATNLNKSFKSKNDSINIINNINISIKSGEIVGLIGPSGCGKTTLLQILGLLQKPDNGNIIIDNIKISNSNNFEIAKILLNKIAFIYQLHHLLNDFTAIENLTINQTINGINNSDARKNAINILEKMNMTHRMNHYPHMLSGGEKQRIAIARAIVKKPKIIFADEPTGSLDPNNTSIILDEMLSFAKEFNIAMLIVTHNHNFINKFDVTYTMNDLNKIVL